MGIFSNFSGGQSRRDLRAGKAASDAALKEGFDTANTRYDQAADLYNPYAQTGGAANTAYANALGLGTAEEQAASASKYFNDPAMQQVLGQQSNALLRKYNSQGSGTGGGRLALAGARVGAENYQNYLTRLQGLGSQGLQATGAQSGIRSGQGDTAFNYGATRAGNAINFSNAMSGTRSTGMNNLLNIAGTAVKAYAASDIRLKRDIKRIGTLPYGLPVYSFRYRNSDIGHVGVMAQEALFFKPEAVAIMADGYLCVNYAAL